MAGGFFAIDGAVEVRLAEHAEQAQIGDAANGPHDVDDLVALLFEHL